MVTSDWFGSDRIGTGLGPMLRHRHPLVAIEAIARPNLVRSAFSPLENKLVKRFPIAIAL